MTKFKLSDSPPSYSEFCELWCKTGWPEYSEDEFKRAIQGSAFWSTARSESGALLGLGRLLSDEARYAYIQDVVVIGDRRRKGIGRALVNALVDAAMQMGLDEIHLISTPQAIGLYQSFGFSSDNDTKHLSLRQLRRRDEGPNLI